MGTQSPGTMKKTDLLLGAALMRLLEKKSFKKITVNDICREAMVSRSAFYQHFEDKYKLLSCCLEQALRIQGDQIKNMPLQKALDRMLTGIQENQKMLYNMFRAELDQELMDIFRDAFQRSVREWLEELSAKGVRLSAPVPALTAFLAGGLAGMTVDWIRENYKTPKEEMATCQCALLMKTMGDEPEEK